MNDRKMIDERTNGEENNKGNDSIQVEGGEINESHWRY